MSEGKPYPKSSCSACAQNLRINCPYIHTASTMAPDASALLNSPVHPIVAEIMAEVEKATLKFPTWPTRIIDAGNVVSEEAGELAKACLQVTYEKHKETLSGVRTEAIQTAAMCIRFLASMDVYDVSPGEQHEQPPMNATAAGQ